MPLKVLAEYSRGTPSDGVVGDGGIGWRLSPLSFYNNLIVVMGRGGGGIGKEKGGNRQGEEIPKVGVRGRGKGMGR